MDGRKHEGMFEELGSLERWLAGWLAYKAIVLLVSRVDPLPRSMGGFVLPDPVIFQVARG